MYFDAFHGQLNFGHPVFLGNHASDKRHGWIDAKRQEKEFIRD